jgi:hypothetical protein
MCSELFIGPFCYANHLLLSTHIFYRHSDEPLNPSTCSLIYATTQGLCENVAHLAIVHAGN